MNVPSDLCSKTTEKEAPPAPKKARAETEKWPNECPENPSRQFYPRPFPFFPVYFDVHR